MNKVVHFVNYLRTNYYAIHIRNAAILVFLLGACTKSTAPSTINQIQPLRFLTLPWSTGEVSEYVVTDSNNSWQGFSVTQLFTSEADEQTLWTMREYISLSAVYWRTEIVIDTRRFQTQTTAHYRQHSLGVTEWNATYWRKSNLVTQLVEVKKKEFTDKRSTQIQTKHIMSDSYDRGTLVTLARALPLVDDYHTQMNVFDPLWGDDKEFEVIVSAEETINIPVDLSTPISTKITAPNATPDWTKFLPYIKPPLSPIQTRKIIFGVPKYDGYGPIEPIVIVWVGVNAPHPAVKFTRDNNTYELIHYYKGKG